VQRREPKAPIYEGLADIAHQSSDFTYLNMRGFELCWMMWLAMPGRPYLLYCAGLH
jgi:hypothetical protein